MKNEQDFLGVKFTTRGWSISTVASGNVGYLSRVLSQAVAFIPSTTDSNAATAFGELIEAELIVVKNVELHANDLIVGLHDVAEDHGISLMLKGQSSKMHIFARGTVVKVRIVSGGYVLILGGKTIPQPIGTAGMQLFNQ